MKPFVPMSPILRDSLPQGDEWVHQLKWDGYRIIAEVNPDGVTLYSKRMLEQNRKYPELVKALSARKGSFILDGEAFMMDHEAKRPSFQKLQQRGMLTGAGTIMRAAERRPVQLMLFDLLKLGDEDLRELPFRERSRMLRELASGWGPPLLVADQYEDGPALWNWVVRGGWEGIVSKRLESPYREGKEHNDWFKRRTVVTRTGEAVGIVMIEGRVASLVMRISGIYAGRVSAGLTARLKSRLSALAWSDSPDAYFKTLPEGLTGEQVRWLDRPLAIEVTAKEMTEGKLLRHPKLLSLDGVPL